MEHSHWREITGTAPEAAKNAYRFYKRLPAIGKGLSYILKKNDDERLSIGSLIEQNAAKRPSSTALIYEDRRYSYRDMNEWVNRYAHYFISQGIKKGDVAAIFLENRPEILAVTGALVKLGAIAALINNSQRSHALVHSFNVSKAKAVVVGEEVMDAFEAIRDEINVKPDEGKLLYLKDEAGQPAPDGYVDLNAASGTASPLNPGTVQNVRLGDPCFYVYTSGTTGLPKAAVMTHKRWIKAGGGFGLGALALTPKDVLYVTLPFYHNNALTIAWASANFGGAAIAMRRKFSASRFWDDTRKFGATSFIYIGELCRYLINQPPRADDADNPVVKITGNGMRPDVWHEFKRRFGISEVYEFYGASECNMAFANFLNLNCTIGLCPAPYAIVKYDLERGEPVLDAEGHMVRVDRGKNGLLIAEVTNTYQFDGYTDKKASEGKLLRNVFKDGDLWFNSGDLLKDLGFKHAQFVDRLGDTFRWKGENVSTTEVEEAANRFDDVEESTVYGVEIPGADGKAGMASIVTELASSDFPFDHLYQSFKEELPAYAIPVFLRIRNELDVTGTFKHQKFKLKQEGFDVDKLKEPIYVLRDKTKGYERLDASTCQQILSGNHAF